MAYIFKCRRDLCRDDRLPRFRTMDKRIQGSANLGTIIPHFVSLVSTSAIGPFDGRPQEGRHVTLFTYVVMLSEEVRPACPRRQRQRHRHHRSRLGVGPSHDGETMLWRRSGGALQETTEVP